MFSNGALLLAASNLRSSSQSHLSHLACINDARNSFQDDPLSKDFNCVAVPRRSKDKLVDLSISSLACLNRPSSGVFSVNLTYTVEECVVHKVMWGWSLFLMICMPYAFVTVRNLKRVMNGNYHQLVNWKTLGFALIVETMHAVGIALMVFIALPALDNVIEVSF